MWCVSPHPTSPPPRHPNNASANVSQMHRSSHSRHAPLSQANSPSPCRNLRKTPTRTGRRQPRRRGPLDVPLMAPLVLGRPCCRPITGVEKYVGLPQSVLCFDSTWEPGLKTSVLSDLRGELFPHLHLRLTGRRCLHGGLPCTCDGPTSRQILCCAGGLSRSRPHR